jgi:hypothetical protein
MISKFFAASLHFGDISGIIGEKPVNVSTLA